MSEQTMAYTQFVEEAGRYTAKEADGRLQHHRVDPYTGVEYVGLDECCGARRMVDHAARYLKRRGARVTTTALWVKRDASFRPDVWLEEVDVLPSGKELLRG